MTILHRVRLLVMDAGILFLGCLVEEKFQGASFYGWGFFMGMEAIATLCDLIGLACGLAEDW